VTEKIAGIGAFSHAVTEQLEALLELLEWTVVHVATADDIQKISFRLIIICATDVRCFEIINAIPYSDRFPLVAIACDPSKMDEIKAKAGPLACLVAYPLDLEEIERTIELA
jgi:hypothetical protein